MNRQITFTVVADGGTDRVLVPIIRWAIHRLDQEVDILEPEFVKRSGSVAEFFESYNSTTMLVFAHRDAENSAVETRLREFDQVFLDGVVPIVPVRMSEAWLLIDGSAIARAADSPNAGVAVPKLSRIEQIADPKTELEQLLFKAAGSPTGRRGKNFRRSMVSRRVNLASLISDYSPLEKLNAFAKFQISLAQVYPYPIAHSNQRDSRGALISHSDR